MAAEVPIWSCVLDNAIIPALLPKFIWFPDIVVLPPLIDVEAIALPVILTSLVNLPLPLTSKVYKGDVVPIPTKPLSNTINEDDRFELMTDNAIDDDVAPEPFIPILAPNDVLLFPIVKLPELFKDANVDKLATLPTPPVPALWKSKPPTLNVIAETRSPVLLLIALELSK